MKRLTKKPLDIIGQICLFGLMTLSLIIAFFLIYSSTLFSYYSNIDASPIYIIHDSWKANLLVAVMILTFTFFLDRLLPKEERRQRLAGYIFLGICAVLFTIIGFVWTSQVPYYPSSDQLNTTAAAVYSLQGRYFMFQKGGYIGIYAQQKGLIFLYEILFSLFGNYSYHIVEKLHVFSGVITMIFGYLFLENISSRCTYRILYCLFLLLCAPYIILMPYAYGDIPSIAYCVVLFWALQMYSKALQKRYVVIACLTGILALFNRTNCWIVLIAVAIGLCMLALEKHSLRPIIAGACIILTAAVSIKALNISYEIRSGYEDTKGTPASLYFAMGMQDNANGPGIYNRYNQSTYQDAGFDRELAAEMGWQEVARRLEAFKADPKYAFIFYKTKLQMQWTDPIFETLLSTDSFSEELPVPEWIDEIYYGKYHDILFRFANFYQTITYLGLLFCVLLIPKYKKDSSFYIPLITVVGGFLFSAIWEAQCRYVLPYYMFLLVYAPIGLCNMCDGIGWVVKKVIAAKKKEQSISDQSESAA